MADWGPPAAEGKYRVHSLTQYTSHKYPGTLVYIHHRTASRERVWVACRRPPCSQQHGRDAAALFSFFCFFSRERTLDRQARPPARCCDVGASARVRRSDLHNRSSELPRP